MGLTDIFRKVNDTTRDRYLKWKYGHLAPKIYYDRRCRAYVAPTVLGEFGAISGDVETVCHALTAWNLCYGFELDGKRTHEHSFACVLQCAYDHAEGFSVPKDCEQDYSAQELEWLDRLVQRGRKDRAEGP
jgi:hypothetical protein